MAATLLRAGSVGIRGSPGVRRRRVARTMSLSPLRRLRFALGRAYATAWRAAAGALARLAPGSVRRERARPVLPGAPVHRRYGLRVGRPVDRFYIERFLEANAGDI